MAKQFDLHQFVKCTGSGAVGFVVGFNDNGTIAVWFPTSNGVSHGFEISKRAPRWLSRPRTTPEWAATRYAKYLADLRDAH